MMLTINQSDPVYCRVNQVGIEILSPLLSCSRIVWKKTNIEKGRFKKEKTSVKQSLIHSDGVFLAGFLPSVLSYLNKQGIAYHLNQQIERLTPTADPNVQGYTLREDQIKMIDSAIINQRGILKAATGIGKTVLAMGLISCFPNKKALILCHTISIGKQTYDKFIQAGIQSVNLLAEGEKNFIGYDIVIATRQTFVKLDPQDYAAYFDIVIIDEAHHCVSLTGDYQKILSNMLAPIRIGLTATTPTEKIARMSMEGYLGPIIEEITISEGQEMGVLSHHKLTLIPVPDSEAFSEIKRYPEMYDEAIVHNRARNRIIATLTSELVTKGRSVLILVQRIAHGENIYNLCKSIYNINCEFVYGDTESETREEVKKALISKNTKCVIASVIWREGVDLPNLDKVIIAAPYKSIIPVLQGLGRGLRKTEDKEYVEIFDFLDSQRWLAEQCIKRLSIYIENGLL